MLKASAVFLLLGILSMALGLDQLAGVSFETGRLLLFSFVALAILSFVAALFAGRPVKRERSAESGPPRA